MRTQDAGLAAPPGFERLTGGGPFMDKLGDLYWRHIDGGIAIGLRVDENHTNLRGIAHGGMLASLADSALGVGLARHCEGKHSFVTVNLSTDFIDAAHPGDWLEARVEVQKIGTRIAFANCWLHAGTKRILRASGVFAVMNPLSPERLFAATEQASRQPYTRPIPTWSTS